jgi:hypothetical protein
MTSQTREVFLLFMQERYIPIAKIAQNGEVAWHSQSNTVIAQNGMDGVEKPIVTNTVTFLIQIQNPI